MYSTKQIRTVLTDSGIRIVNELDNEFLIFCPYHPNWRTPAAEVNKESGMLYCFSCRARASLVETIVHATGKSVFEVMRLVDANATPTTLEIKDPVPDFVPFDMDLINRLHSQVEGAAQYLASRKITRQSAEKYLIGFSHAQQMVTVPVHSPTGICVGFVGRSITGKTFKNSEHLPKSKTLFNLHRNRLCDTIVLVESTFDAIRIEQVGHKAVASLGSGISNAQLDLLTKTFNEITVIPDADDAGKIMAEKLVKRLGPRLTIATLPTGFKDVGDMDDPVLLDFLNNMDPLQAYINRKV